MHYIKPKVLRVDTTKWNVSSSIDDLNHGKLYDTETCSFCIMGALMLEMNFPADMLGWAYPRNVLTELGLGEEMKWLEELGASAIMVNDSARSDSPQVRSKLTKIFASYGIELEFV